MSLAKFDWIPRLAGKKCLGVVDKETLDKAKLFL